MARTRERDMRDIAHGAVTTSLLDHLRRRRGLPTRGTIIPYSRETAYERLADAAHQFLAGPLLDQLAGRS